MNVPYLILHIIGDLYDSVKSYSVFKVLLFSCKFGKKMADLPEHFEMCSYYNVILLRTQEANYEKNLNLRQDMIREKYISKPKEY